MTIASLDLAIDACFDALSRAPSGVFSDFDGTLSPVAPTPNQALPAPGAQIALQRLAELVDTVAIVTGRSASDARDRIPVPGVSYIGNHGFESIIDGVASTHPDALAQIASVNEAMDAIEQAITERGIGDGLVLENKSLSGSIHYRLAPDQEMAHHALTRIVGAECQKRDLAMTEGKLVIEVRPKLNLNKGTAVEQIIASRSLTGAIMLGDDLTDVDAFLAIQRGRQRGLAGVSVGVVTSETHPLVLEQADFCLADVSESVILLESLADLLIAQR